MEFTRVLGATDRGPTASAIHSQQQRWGASKHAQKAAQRLTEPGSVAVVTGQQAGLFGGPLYSVLKAVCVIKLSRQFGMQHPQRQFIPMFWIATGDSDYEEVRKTYIVDSEGGIQELALPPAAPDQQRFTIEARDDRAATQQLLGKLDAVLPSGEYRDEVIAALETDYAEGNLVAGFGRWMARLFSETELVIIDPQDPALMQSTRGLIRHELQHAEELASILTRRNQELSTAGYELQVSQPPEDTNLFLLDAEGRREKISRTTGGFVLRPSGRRMSLDELLAISQLSPERFVCGVLLRPVYQNVLFPVIAWVGGPAEISYRAQATALAAHHGVKTAPAYLRTSATLLPQRSAALLSELGWEISDCFTVIQDLEQQAALTAIPAAVEAALIAYRAAINTADQDLRRAATELDASLAASFETLKGNLTRHVDKLEKKITSVLKKRRTAQLRRIQIAHSQVYPQLQPQERVLSLLSFLPRYGFAIMALLLDGLTVPSFNHQIMVLD